MSSAVDFNIILNNFVAYKGRTGTSASITWELLISSLLVPTCLWVQSLLSKAWLDSFAPSLSAFFFGDWVISASAYSWVINASAYCYSNILLNKCKIQYG